MELPRPIVCAALLLGFASVLSPPATKSLAGAELLEQQLLREGAASLAAAARRQGDAQRGAILFHHRVLGCAVCHLPSGDRPAVGPDLTKPQEGATDVYLVESVLQPSKSVRKGYESIQVVTNDGRTITGLLAEDRPDALVLRSSGGDFELIPIAKDEIDERQTSPLSLMPDGLVNQLSGREQFVDLLRYVLEIAEYGPQRAAQLRPPPGLYAETPLPEYERHVDHAGLLADLNDASFRRGEAIYGRVCANCHGTHEVPGSLPTSLRFASGKFKNGSDPYSLYRTLTHGFGLMAPQRWMVPREKYDVIHYLREAYLKRSNPTQYVRIDPAYLAGLPKGDTRGPAPNAVEPWAAMDYGPSLVNTYEIGGDGSNFAYKGIAIRLDGGPGGVSRGRRWMVFEHDTLRMAAAWSARPDKGSATFIDYNGIHFNGRHQVHPRVVGRVHLASHGLGWGDPEAGGFKDVRLRGRDNKPYGPLPRSWGRFKGFYRHDDRIILSYAVGGTDVLEMPGAVGPADEHAPLAFTRTFNIGPRARELVLHVADHPADKAQLRVVQREQERGGRIAIVEPDRAALASEEAKLKFDGKTSLEPADPEDFDLSDADYTIAARIRTTQGGAIFCQTRPGDRWASGGKAFFVRGGRLCFDIGWVGVVESQRKVDDGRWHDVAVVWRRKTGEVRLSIDGRPDRQGVLRAGEPLVDPVVRLGFGAPDFPQPQSYFQGQIAEVRFWNRALADEELAQPAAKAPADKSLIARWRFGATEAGIVPDGATKRHAATILRSGDGSDAHGVLAAGLSPDLSQAKWTAVDGELRLHIPAGNDPLRFTLWMSDGDVQDAGAPIDLPTVDLSSLTHGGPARWPQTLQTQGMLGPDDGPFAADVLPLPVDSPWSCQLRLTGFDFFQDGQAAAVCTWDGDVWLVRGVDRPEQGLAWRRIASGLFQPLGLKIVGGQIHVGCRDQIVILHDLDGDGETDFYQNFNSDHQVTEHFHEFAMGLQADSEGNFYYAKSARHALPAVVPHHGALLRVSPDGRQTDILATGFRA
ncbi:MAG TPA: DUF6797 domain-containing protein, partial [Pirellulales bacterium]|nr:DUF6797 domain-containing protein [Pirellulales bacterium]